MNIREAIAVDGKTVSVMCDDGQTFTGRVFEVDVFEEGEPESLTVETAEGAFFELRLDEIVSCEVLK